MGYRHRRTLGLGLHPTPMSSASLLAPNSPAVMQSVSSAKSRTGARGLSMASLWPQLGELSWWGQHLCFRSHRRKFSCVSSPGSSRAQCSPRPCPTSFSVCLSLVNTGQWTPFLERLKVMATRFSLYPRLCCMCVGQRALVPFPALSPRNHRGRPGPGKYEGWERKEPGVPGLCLGRSL